MTTRTEPRAPAGGERAEVGPQAPGVLHAPAASEVARGLEALAGARVAVALSGGVDSAVAAARLVDAGVEVVGLALRLHDPDPDNPLAPRACCPPDDLQDARRVAEQLGFPFYVLDGRRAFSEQVVAPFVRSYLSGRTPNPCVGCNAFVKLEALHRRARALGCVALATGHYARLRVEAGRPLLFAGADRSKDQSYFLHGTDPALLAALVFPLGATTKDEVRTEATRRGLPVAHKLDSQEVCFVGGAGAGAFVRRQPEAQGDHAGPIVDESGRTLGRHSGVMHFTVGQRRGLGVAAPQPLHVIGLDAASRTVTVGPADRLLERGLLGRRARWPSGAPAEPTRARVRIRYRDPGTEALVTALDDHRVEVRFDRPVRAIAPGQAAVFYRGDQVLGGAVIEHGFGRAP